MDDSKKLLADLPGSSRGGKGNAGVSNYDLMPSSKRLPGQEPAATKSADAPSAHMFGNGNKIPESHESRMRSQFANPDPAKFGAKKMSQTDAPQRSDGWSSEVRHSLVPCSVYKSTPAAGDSSPRAVEAQAKQIAMDKAKIKSEQKRLIGYKEAALSNICSGSTPPPSSEVYRTMSVVGEINKKLGLPYTDTGGWVLPRS